MYHKINLQNATPTVAMNSKALKQFQQMGSGGGRNLINSSRTHPSKVSASQF